MSERFLLCRERLVLALSQFEIKEGHRQILLSSASPIVFEELRVT